MDPYLAHIERVVPLWHRLGHGEGFSCNKKAGSPERLVENEVQWMFDEVVVYIIREEIEVDAGDGSLDFLEEDNQGFHLLPRCE